MTRAGKITGVKCIKMKLGEPDETGRRRPIPIKGSESVIDLDNLIVAIGEDPDLYCLGKKKSVEISQKGSIEVCPETLATNIKGVFAGGDVVTGPGTVINAMSAGNTAAEMIDKYIKGKELVREYKLTRPSRYIPPYIESSEKETGEASRPRVPCLPAGERIKNFNEVNLNITEEEAVMEARRCLRCDLETKDGEKAIKSLSDMVM
jgi:NADH-quinone oxidoreductase subunit F